MGLVEVRESNDSGQPLQRAYKKTAAVFFPLRRFLNFTTSCRLPSSTRNLLKDYCFFRRRILWKAISIPNPPTAIAYVPGSGITAKSPL